MLGIIRIEVLTQDERNDLAQIHLASAARLADLGKGNIVATPIDQLPIVASELDQSLHAGSQTQGLDRIAQTILQLADNHFHSRDWSTYGNAVMVLTTRLCT